MGKNKNVESLSAGVGTISVVFSVYVKCDLRCFGHLQIANSLCLVGAKIASATN